LTGLSAAAISDALVVSAGASFNNEQKEHSRNLSEAFMEDLHQREDFEYLPDKEYMINISSAISLTAWQEYHHHNYDQAMRYMDRVFELGIASEEDYLLRAKLTRTLSNNYQSNAEALRLINTALAMHDFDFVEALAEKGLILIRLGEVAQAREVFVDYKEAVSEVPNIPAGKNATWASRMLIKCDQLMQKR
jgi:tetratricopeptide (TPR) repeat protein